MGGTSDTDRRRRLAPVPSAAAAVAEGNVADLLPTPPAPVWRSPAESP
ncbi:hypothetical protein BN2537_2859 [Streptomyces venezuelae]|nr:hypothetical protein BN2537_2859 [Streptomyces venezuelae]